MITFPKYECFICGSKLILDEFDLAYSCVEDHYTVYIRSPNEITTVGFNLPDATNTRVTLELDANILCLRNHKDKGTFFEMKGIPDINWMDLEEVKRKLPIYLTFI
jgi:hypothetical protein